VKQMKKVILELGKNFLYIAEKHKLQVGNSDFFIDLLFYHRGLQCLVAFELKADKFKPEHLGQLNFYLEALDRDMKKPNKNPSIGILLCKDKDSEVVEYALSISLSPTKWFPSIKLSFLTRKSCNKSYMNCSTMKQAKNRIQPT
jgi:hypothetical protein